MICSSQAFSTKSDSERQAYSDQGYDRAFEPLLDSEEAATFLKIHPKTLQKLARNGEVHAIKIGKLWRFRASDLNHWINEIVRRGS